MADKIKRAIAWGAFNHFEGGFTLVEDGNPLNIGYDIVGRSALELQVRVKEEGKLARYFTIKVTEHI